MFIIEDRSRSRSEALESKNRDQTGLSITIQSCAIWVDLAVERVQWSPYGIWGDRQDLPWSHSVVHQHMQHSCTLWVVYNFTDCLFGTFTYKRVNYKCKIYSSKFRHDWSDKKKDTLYNNWLLRCKWNFGTQLYVQLITLCSVKVLNRLKLYLIEI